jgi:hypothetical protein
MSSAQNSFFLFVCEIYPFQFPTLLFLLSLGTAYYVALT